MAQVLVCVDNIMSFRGGWNVNNGYGFHYRGGQDTRGSGHSINRKPRKCTYYGRIRHIVRYCWDLHCKTFAHHVSPNEDHHPL